jgi:FkbM family methyltransferase
MFDTSKTPYTIITVDDRNIINIQNNKSILKDFQFIDSIPYVNGNKEDCIKILKKKNISLDTWLPYDKRVFPPLPGELGIWTSFINVLEYIVNKEIDEFLVFEDDIVLDKDFVKKFKVIKSELPKDYDFLCLRYNLPENTFDKTTDVGLKHIHKSYNQYSNAQGLLISNTCAKKLLNLVKEYGIQYTSDCFIFDKAKQNLLNGFSIKEDKDYLIKDPEDSVKSVVDPQNLRHGVPMFVNRRVLDILLKLQLAIKPDISIEVGAFDAYVSKIMSNFHIPTFAFEASPYVYENYKDSADKITYVNKAVSDVNGSIKFEIQSEYDASITGNNSIKNRVEDKEYQYINVDSVSIDEYFKDIKFEKGFLWVDAEGANREVLTGAKDKLKDFATIHIEVESKEYWKDSWKRQDVIGYLKAYGFHLCYEFDSPYVGQSDIIFVNEKFLDLISHIIPKTILRKIKIAIRNKPWQLNQK